MIYGGMTHDLHNSYYLYFSSINIDFGDPQGFLALRVLLPILAMGICILKAIKNNEKK